MKPIDAVRLQLKAMEMVEGTELGWTDCMRYKASKSWLRLALENYSIDDIELALGIVEGKPVWEGVELWCLATNHKFTVKGMCNSGYAFEYSKEYQGRQCVHKDEVSWLPPTPKTAMVELLVTDIEMYVNAEFCGKRLSEACRKTLSDLK